LQVVFHRTIEANGRPALLFFHINKNIVVVSRLQHRRIKNVIEINNYYRPLFDKAQKWMTRKNQIRELNRGGFDGHVV
jgi:hypothetical protein